MSDTFFLGFQLDTTMPAVSNWGMLIFIGFLGYLLEYRFAQNTRQLRTANVQLEEYSTTLEQKVETRTHDLKEKNEALAATLHDLRTTQDHLIQSKKLASLGQLARVLGKAVFG